MPESDLFPELVTWAPIIDGQISSPYLQSIPIDVSESLDESDLIAGDAHVHTSIFDPTTLSIGIDSSCLDGLDELLLYSPTDAFAATCWADCVHSAPTRVHVRSPTSVRPTKPLTRVPLVIDFSSDESDSDSDECRTYDDSVPLSVTQAHHDISSGLAKLTKGKSLFYNDEDSFMFFEPHFTISNPKESVGYFPITSRQPKRTSRLAAFCTNLPLRLMKTS